MLNFERSPKLETNSDENKPRLPNFADHLILSLLLQRSTSAKTIEPEKQEIQQTSAKVLSTDEAKRKI